MSPVAENCRTFYHTARTLYQSFSGGQHVPPNIVEQGDISSMAEVTESQVMEALRSVKDPDRAKVDRGIWGEIEGLDPGSAHARRLWADALSGLRAMARAAA